MSFIGFLNWLFLAVHVLACLSLIGIVLVQGGKGASLSASFGMGSASAFGAQTDQFMVKWTRNVAITFMVTSVVLAYLSPRAGSIVQRAEIPRAQETPGVSVSGEEKTEKAGGSAEGSAATGASREEKAAGADGGSAAE
ncbi:MAG: preprotein translocase subunit SecG [Candidatus Hydrogenedentota bacterium]|nr:MAG: preprotein translocase subunit SecG [Candidatus Hydrogenedentota bacterium]